VEESRFLGQRQARGPVPAGAAGLADTRSRASGAETFAFSKESGLLGKGFKLYDVDHKVPFYVHFIIYIPFFFFFSFLFYY
jgi:hypothetical protein